jgi:hypothetical protein
MKREEDYIVSKRDKEKYLSEAPLHIKNSSNPDVQNLWAEFKKIDEALETHPLRYYSFITKKGDTDHIDCTWPNFKNIITKKGGLETDIFEAQKRFKLLGELVRKKSTKKRQLDKATGQIARRVGILDIEESRLLEWFGKFYSVKEVQEKLKKELYYSPSLPQIEKWYKEHETEIDRLRTSYTLKNKEFRIATDSGRLETLNELLNHFDEKFKKDGKIEYSKEIRAILEQARKEVKGNELHLTVDGKIDINASIQANINITQTMQRIPVNALVIGLTAAKQGLNPERIMSQLASSYYKNLTGFNGEITGNEEVYLPSKLIKQYDWGELTRINKNRKESNQTSSIKDIITITDSTDKQKSDMKKEDLLKSLIKYQKDINK